MNESMKYFHVPEEVGISRQAIANFLQALQAHNYRLHALMIARRSGVCYADAAAPYTLDTPHRLCSAAKSILSLNLLAAMEEGKLHTDDLVTGFFPEISCENAQMAHMRVSDLLTMQTGQQDDPFPALFQDFDADLIDLFLHTPPVEEPGMHFRYNNTVPHMIYAVTERATGERIEAYQRRHFCEPMGASMWAPTNSRGQYNPVVTSMSANSFMKYALLYLREGDWFGHRLLQAETIRQATKEHVRTGQTGNEAGYGWQIWRNAFGGYRMDGGWGQYAIVLPELDAAVTILSDMTDSSYALEAFETYLLPALKNKDPLNNTVSEPLPHIPGMAPVGDAVPASEWKNEKWRSSEDETISFALEDDQVRLHQYKKGIERVFSIGLHGKWLENPSHLWTSAHFSIDTGVYGIPDEPCWFSGAWMSPYRFEMIGKSLGEMGEYRYAFELIKGELEIQYTPQMQHNVSSLLDCEKMRGEAIR